MRKLCETCGQELDIDEAVAGDAVCRQCIENWEKVSEQPEEAKPWGYM